MPSAKRLLEKLARFYRRIKRRNTTELADDRKSVQFCHKGSNTMRDELELVELGNMPFDDQLELDEKPNKNNKLNMKSRNKNKSKAELVADTEVPRATITIAMENKRMAAGTDVDDTFKSRTYHQSPAILDEGPILETGISRLAFCRQLDNLLQRGLGHDVSRDSSYC